MFYVSVPEGSVYIVERLGRFHRTLPPGRHFIAPVFDRVARRFEVKQTVRIETPRATIKFRIVDPQRAHENVADIKTAVQRLAEMVVQDVSETRAALKDANQLASMWGITLDEVVVDRF